MVRITYNSISNHNAKVNRCTRATGMLYSVYEVDTW